MHKLFSILLIMGCAYSGTLSAQKKFERESRIKEKDVPAKALRFVDEVAGKNSLKWYREEALTGESIEAKFRHNNAKYSIEFDTSGNVADIEITVDWGSLNPGLREAVELKLKSDCLKHQVIKVQKQYTGSESNLLSMLKTGADNPSLTVKYELVVRCSKQRKVSLFEYLFSESGKQISASEIIFKNSSHLVY
ncbi:MAG: hypothetical protein K0M56_03340 [Kaistella sp.]|nr:hypothetical protein [Kaistella sp.]